MFILELLLNLHHTRTHTHVNSILCISDDDPVTEETKIGSYGANIPACTNLAAYHRAEGSTLDIAVDFTRSRWGLSGFELNRETHDEPEGDSIGRSFVHATYGYSSQG